jgi:TldD protein
VQEHLLELIDRARGSADYADARYVRTRVERVATRNGQLDELDASESEGIGVRVRHDGAWGFAATRGLGRRDAEAALERALSIARTQPRAGRGVALAPEPPARGTWANAVERDPFGIALEEKLARLEEADVALRAENGVSIALTRFEALAVDKLFASTEGALCEQHTTDCGGGIAAVAVDGDHTQVRSFPASHGGQVTPGGYERFLALDLSAAAPRVAEEAAALLSAPACPRQRTTLILAGEQLGLQIHESVGHAVELDRVLGREASYAGTSFVPVDGIGSFRLGSEHVDVVADATNPDGLGSYRWDDEGVEGQAVPIVRNGVLAGFLSSRETAAETGLGRSGGCMRADGFARQPIVRMTNVNLAPRDAGSLDELIAGTDSGILVETNRSWSIDDRRLHFQFEGEAAWEIRHGQRRRLLRNPSYAGVTPEFWRSCDAVCSACEWRLISLLGCGKGEPGQVMRVSHGCAPARFRDVDVGVA